MRLSRIALAPLVASLLVTGCGVQAPSVSSSASGKALGASAPGWGQKTTATLTVPAAVMADVHSALARIDARFAQDHGKNPNLRLVYQVDLIASRDGFKTSVRGGIPGFKPSGKPHAQDYDLGRVPAGTYAYYLTMSAKVIDTDPSGVPRSTGKIYGPHYVSDFGRNFTAEVRY